MDDLFASLMEGGDREQHVDVGTLESEADDGERSKSISELLISGKIRLALLGKAGDRAVLVRDSNKLVAMAVNKSPKVIGARISLKMASRPSGVRWKRRTVPNPRTPVSRDASYPSMAAQRGFGTGLTQSPPGGRDRPVVKPVLLARGASWVGGGSSLLSARIKGAPLVFAVRRELAVQLEGVRDAAVSF